MRTLSYIAAIIFALTFNISAQEAAGGRAKTSLGLRETFDRLVDGIKRVNAGQVMSVYQKSERLLIYNNNGTATNGWDNVNANVTATYEKLSNVTLDITGLRIEMIGKTAAVLTCKWKQTQDNDGKTESASGRMTLVFKLVGKEWKITHRHTSPDKPDATRPVFPSEREP